MAFSKNLVAVLQELPCLHGAAVGNSTSITIWAELGARVSGTAYSSPWGYKSRVSESEHEASFLHRNFLEPKPIQIGSKSYGRAASHTRSAGMTQEKLRFTVFLSIPTWAPTPGNQEISVLIQSPTLTALGCGHLGPLRIVHNHHLQTDFVRVPDFLIISSI